METKDLKKIQISYDMGSENYNQVAAQIKEFLKFNGYDKTLQSIEKEEIKVMAEKAKQQELNRQSAANEVSDIVFQICNYFESGHMINTYCFRTKH